MTIGLEERWQLKRVGAKCGLSVGNGAKSLFLRRMVEEKRSQVFFVEFILFYGLDEKFARKNKGMSFLIARRCLMLVS